MTDPCSLFLRAVEICTGADPIKRRLVSAWLECLQQVQPADLPASLQADFHQLLHAMQAVNPQPNENPAQASVRKMSDTQAAGFTASIVRMTRALLQPAEAPADGSQQPVVDIIFDRNFGGSRQLN